MPFLKSFKAISCLSISDLHLPNRDSVQTLLGGETYHSSMGTQGQSDRLAIAGIQAQLGNHFLPAVKNVAISGNELLRAFQGLQKATENYCGTLGAFARSAKGASPEAEKYGKNLLEISKQFKEVMQHHERSVNKFHEFVIKTNKFSTEEKDKQKDLFGSFQKMEKTLQKNKNQEKLDSFYAEQKGTHVRQQEMRYKFFMDKHEEWFQTYVDLIEYCQEVANKEDERSKEVEQPKAVIAAVTAEVVEEAPKANGHKESESNKTSTRSSSASSIEGVRTRVSTQDDPNSISLISEKQRKSVLVEPKTAAHTLSSTDQSRAQSFVAPSQQNQPIYQNQQNPLAEIAQENVVFTQSRDWELNPPPPIEYRARDPSPVRTRPALQPLQTYAPPAPEPVPQRAPPKFGYQVFPPMTTPVYAAAPATKPTPAPRPAIVPTMFSAHDYGMSLEVNEDFNANGQDQLTVNRGDRVILIKSGNRGWIFIKEQATNRTGWIPAQFASKI
ncbi:unnamed protein product, partial [Mesorhabditis belari]|uniref:SH3 domain-containing protein n=1 Tax=Mesorhabditis belari TaxID=2138241 RepID=A0AAF3J345_9BILA